MQWRAEYVNSEKNPKYLQWLKTIEEPKLLKYIFLDE
jgi:hypothetical protein